MYRIFFIVCILANTNILAQKNDNSSDLKKKKANTKSIKVYMDFKNFNIINNHIFKTQNTTLVTDRKESGIYPSVGYSKLMKNDHFKEISISYMGINFRKIDDFITFVDTTQTFTIPANGSEHIYRLHLGGRFEYAFPIFKQVNSKSHFYIGESVEPIIFTEYRKPLSTAFFERSTIVLNNIIAFSPRYILDITKNISLDLNVPIPIMNINFIHDEWQNPILPSFERRRNDATVSFLKYNYQVRVGVGVKI